MTPDALVERLVAAQLDEAEAHRKRALCEAILRDFHRLSHDPPRHAWWVPGRLEVFGKHTDYAGGHSLVATVPRGFVLAARDGPAPIVRLFDSSRRAEFAVDMQSPESGRARTCPRSDAGDGITGWRRYASAVVHRLLRNFPGPRAGADIVFASDLPSASGMSSSSALVIGLAASLVEIWELRGRAEWQANVRTRADEAAYYACFENGLSFGTLAGDAGVGTHGGSEDHLAIVCGAPNRLSAWTFVPVRHVADLRVPDRWTFVIAASGAPAQKTGPAQDAYNTLSLRVKAMLELWNRHEPPRPSLAAAMASSPDAPARMRNLLASSGRPPEDVAQLGVRLLHLLGEDLRVVQAVEAFRSADPRRIGELSDASQLDAETLLGNQVPETIALARTARALGAFAASAFGAGFGGSVWALVPRDAAGGFAERWMAGYRERFPARSTAVAFVAPPGPPLTKLV